jgi:Tfp pilus assembly protein PilP
MEEDMSWGEAFGTAVGHLTGSGEDGGSARAIRMVFLLIFLGGTGWAVYNYHKAQVLLEEKGYYPSTPPTAAAADKRRLEDMVGQVRVSSESRAQSLTIVQSMGILKKYVFADPSTASLSASGGEPAVRAEVPQVVIDYPPDGITLRAIMTMGKQQVAVMDIPGVGSGMIVRPGSTFMQRKGRIVRIAPDKVVISWGGRNWDIAPGF